MIVIMKVASKVASLLLGYVIVLFICSAMASNAYAVQYDLIAPTGQLSRGQDTQFTINIDTEGQSLTAAEIGMTYEAGILQYVSTTPGDTFTTIGTETQEGGKLIFKASSSSGFSGTGTFAIVTFKIIATAPGSTELCVLFAPTTAPPVQPTALPKTGSTNQAAKGIMIGTVLFLIAATGLIFSNKKEYSVPKLRKSHKTLH